MTIQSYDPREVRVYKFIIRFFEENWMMPTYKEIMQGLNYKSPWPIQEAMQRLKYRGLIDFEPNKARSIKLLKYKIQLIEKGVESA